MYQGTWSMPAGGSYAARLIKDAGGTYPWADKAGTGNVQLNFEAVYAKGGQARSGSPTSSGSPPPTR